MLFLLLLSCRDRSEPGPARELLSPFPTAALLQDGHLALPEGAFPQADGGTPMPVARLDFRTGFSPVQTAVIDPGVALDPDSLPGADQASAGQGSVQVWDLDTGQPVRAFAEIDAWPDLGDETPTLLVRPMVPYTPGHTIAVVLTAGVREAGGGSWPRPAWFQSYLDDHPADGFDDEARQTRALVERLEGYGVEDITLAFSFPVDDGGAAWMDALLARRTAHGAWTWTQTDDADLGDALPPGAWRQISGTFTVDNFLVDNAAFSVVDGVPEAQGTAEAKLLVHIPDSARDAAPGTVPVWIFGHGIFSTPEDYLSDLDDPSAVVAVADAAGAIVIATPWRGLTLSDLGSVLGAVADFGRLPEVTDKLAQGLINQATLLDLVAEGALLDDPVFEGLADPDQLFYYGISLGAIEGAAWLAREDRFRAAVLHVGGSAWSTMLERSFPWASLEPTVSGAVPSPRDRQLLYALSQLYWDPADPGPVASRLAGRPLLWQMSVGDEFVPNLSTETLARGVGVTVLEPSGSVPAGLSSATGPLPGPVLALFDPELGTPAMENRPPAESGAHLTPRTWPGTQAQVQVFLDPAAPGVATHPCGDAPCSAENPG